MPHINTLRARLTVKISLMLLVSMAMFSLGLILFIQRSNESRARDALRQTVQLLREEVRTTDDGSVRTLQNWAADNTEYLAGRHIELAALDTRGRPVYLLHPALAAWTEASDKWFLERFSAGGYAIVLGSPRDRLAHRIRTQVVLIIVSGLSMLLMAIVGVWVVIKHTLTPIGMLAQQAAHASVNTSRVRLLAPSQDEEIQELVSTLNHLIDRLSDSLSAKGRFFASVSHELRTPLQALLGQLEVTLSRKRACDEYESALREAMAQTQRLTGLVRSLLLLHQVESTPATLPDEAVSVAELCERILPQYAARIAGGGLTLATTLTDDREIRAPMSHALMLVRNLVDNAVNYAAPGGDLSVSVQGTERAQVLQIYNTCAPVADWNDADILEPFTRRQASSRHGQEGNGLGLTICSSIVKVNRWDLSLQYDGSGITATVVFPLPGNGIP